METTVNEVSNFLAGTFAMTAYWILAIAGTIVFGLTLLTGLLGLGGVDHADFDAADGSVLDHPDTGMLDFKLISIRSIFAFLTVFGWGGIVTGGGLKGFLISLVLGILTMFLTAYSFYLILKLQGSGNVKAEDFIGKTGSVYIGIPGGNEEGKVTVTAGGSTHELRAIADQAIPTGSTILVKETLGNGRYKVEEYKS